MEGDWKEALAVFENEQDLEKFVEKASKALAGKDLDALKAALKQLAKIENPTPECKKAIRMLADLAGAGYGYGEPGNKIEKSLEEMTQKIEEIGKLKTTIEGLTTKITEIEKKITPPAADLPKPKSDPLGDALSGKKK